jgi:hypothetical protein
MPVTLLNLPALGREVQHARAAARSLKGGLGRVGTPP